MHRSACRQIRRRPGIPKHPGASPGSAGISMTTLHFRQNESNFPCDISRYVGQFCEFSVLATTLFKNIQG